MRILIVDHCKTDLMLLTQLAHGLGAREVSPYSGAERALASALGLGCDLIILDYQLPGIGGIDFIRKIRRHPTTWNVPIVMITKADDPAIKQAAIDAGATAFLRKPINVTELTSRLRNLLALRRAMRAPKAAGGYGASRLNSPRGSSRLASMALGAVLVILSASALLGAYFSQRAGQETRRATEISNAFEQARFCVAAEESSEHRYRLDPSAAVRLQHRQAADCLVGALHKAVSLGDVDDGRIIDAVLVKHAAYLSGLATVFAAVDAGDTVRAARLDAQNVDPSFEAIETQVARAADRHRVEAARHLADLARVQNTVLVATPIGFCLGMALAMFFSSLIRRYRRQAEEGLIRETNAMRDSEQRFRALVQNTSDLVLICSGDAKVTYQSPPAHSVWKHANDELVGQSLGDHIHPDDRAAAQELLGQLLGAPGSTRSIELRFRNADRLWRHVQLILTNLLGEAGIAGLVVTIRDITERKVFEEQLTQQAFYDCLTGLPNRALLRDRLDQALSRAARNRSTIGLLFIDLDNFKLINDSLGHRMGDLLLSEVSTRLATCLQGANTIARLGGDEFVVLLDRLEREADATVIADGIVKQLDQPFRIESHTFIVTASIGIALGVGGLATPDTMLRDADIAMYRAKSEGKARHVLFDAAMQTQALARLELESDLRRAVRNGEFRVFYQPIMELATGCVAGAEALVRWEHPTRGLVSPIEFIPVAEETGLIVPLGQWVLEEACRHAALWQARSPASRPLNVSVNLSPRQFQQPSLLEEVQRALREAGLPAGNLKLEITESVIMSDVETTIRILGQLKELGIQIAIDDFGTGYSSLAHLKRLPLDVLKIDRSFVTGIGRDREDTAIVRAIIALARSLDLSTTAEGIETAAQAEQLSAWGCDRAQGYYFAPPLDATAFSSLLDEVGPSTSFAPPALREAAAA